MKIPRQGVGNSEHGDLDWQEDMRFSTGTLANQDIGAADT